MPSSSESSSRGSVLARHSARFLNPSSVLVAAWPASPSATEVVLLLPAIGDAVVVSDRGRRPRRWHANSSERDRRRGRATRRLITCVPPATGCATATATRHVPPALRSVLGNFASVVVRLLGHLGAGLRTAMRRRRVRWCARGPRDRSRAPKRRRHSGARRHRPACPRRCWAWSRSSSSSPRQLPAVARSGAAVLVPAVVVALAPLVVRPRRPGRRSSRAGAVVVAPILVIVAARARALVLVARPRRRGARPERSPPPPERVLAAARDRRARAAPRPPRPARRGGALRRAPPSARGRGVRAAAAPRAPAARRCASITPAR